LFDQLVENREILAQVAMAAGAIISPLKNNGSRKPMSSAATHWPLSIMWPNTYGLPRDFLVEISIGRLLPVISSEQKKQEKRKQVLAEMERLLGHGEALLEKSEQMLGADDHATRQLTLAVIQLKGCWDALGEQVELGKGIEEYR
jgi:hypothetical protein